MGAEEVVLGVVIGGFLGAVFANIISKQPPFTLNAENPSPLDLSNQGFLTLGGVGSGAILGGGLALASGKP